MPEKRQKRQEQNGRSKSLHEVLAKALKHPLRATVLTILNDRIACPKEIADQLDERLATVSYHARVLEEMGLVEIVEEGQVRGATVHYYKAVDRPVVGTADWEKLDPNLRSAFSAYVFEGLISDVAKSLSSGILDRRDDRVLDRLFLLLDAKGWLQVREIQEHAKNQILKVQAAAAGRLEDTGGDPLHVIAGLLCFEVPPSTEG